MRYITPFLLALPVLAFCDDAKIPESYEQRLQTLEDKLERGYNSPFVSSRGIYFSADALYMTAKETGLAYALKVDSPIVLYPNRLSYDVKQLQFDWDFGFRVAMGYDFQRDGWDVGLSWSHFFTRAEDHGTITANEGLIPIWSSPNFITFSQTASSADADWKLNYDQVDLALGRGYYVGKYFVLRPSIAGSALWIDQHYDLKYARQGQFPGTDHTKLKNRFEGIGLNAGIDLLFTFRGGWSIYGKGSLGLYSGSFHLKSHEVFTTIDGESEKIQNRRNLHIGSPACAMAMGFRWEHPFSKERYSFSVKLLWENLFFFGQNQLYRFVTPSDSGISGNFIANQGDLAFQGGSFSLMLGF